MSIVDAKGNPVTPQLTQQQVMQLMTGLRIRVDAANAQLVQLGLLVEYLYDTIEESGIDTRMEGFPDWAENRYEEIQNQAKQAVQDNEEWAEGLKQKVAEDLKEVTESAGLDLSDQIEQALTSMTTGTDTTETTETTTGTDTNTTDT